MLASLLIPVALAFGAQAVPAVSDVAHDGLQEVLRDTMIVEDQPILEHEWAKDVDTYERTLPTHVTREHVVKLDCVGCLFQTRRVSYLEEAFLPNSLLLYITVNSTDRYTLMFNGISIVDLYSDPLSFHAYQVPTEFERYKIQSMVDNGLLSIPDPHQLRDEELAQMPASYQLGWSMRGMKPVDCGLEQIRDESLGTNMCLSLRISALGTFEMRDQEQKAVLIGFHLNKDNEVEIRNISLRTRRALCSSEIPSFRARPQQRNKAVCSSNAWQHFFAKSISNLAGSIRKLGQRFQTWRTSATTHRPASHTTRTRNGTGLEWYLWLTIALFGAGLTAIMTKVIRDELAQDRADKDREDVERQESYKDGPDDEKLGEKEGKDAPLINVGN